MHTLLFTDVENSTRFHEAFGDERAAAVWTAHDRRSRDLLARHGGREIGRADGGRLDGRERRLVFPDVGPDHEPVLQHDLGPFRFSSRGRSGLAIRSDDGLRAIGPDDLDARRVAATGSDIERGRRGQ